MDTSTTLAASFGVARHSQELLLDPNSTHLSHAALRAFVAVFRVVCGFFGADGAVFLALGAASSAGGDSSLGCFAVRSWP